ncbi:ABC transporter permease [Tepidimicrobium xylanilyticum]|uniref:ABC transporter permease n=1 Tax=Tepidimicrobium xylanilyticum TaxID=1123352 RepID=UPI0013566EDF|nr:ABC-2 family transporter protein [Tepidimicrobium xylanilyticum]GMG95227.1 hypothetical protein EN5CB1_00530 [Tepidimicrobium xylanilyticum]
MKKYIRILQIEFCRMKEYALNFMGQIMYLPLKLLIIYLIWKFVYASTSTIKDYTFEDIITYYFLLNIFETAIAPVGITAYQVFNDINIGNLDMYLTKPICYPLYLFCTKIGYFFWGITSGLIFLYLSKAVIGIKLPVNIANFALSLSNVFLGLVIMYSLFFIVGELTFWVKNILTLRDNLWNVIKLLSGQILPIAFFPEILTKLSRWLPFQYIYYVPVSIFQGKYTQVQAIKHLGFQIIWVAVLSTIMIVLWATGIRKYESQGG